MVSPARKDGRVSTRITVSLPVHVAVHDAENRVTRELTYSESVSDMGAGFYINRIFEVGHLVNLKLPLDAALRKHDYDAPLYEVWGVVRHCERSQKGGGTFYHIGVAFIGETPPAGYRKNPHKLYEPIGLRQDGFWEIRELECGPATRRHPRYSIPIEVYIAVYDDNDNIRAHEKTVTENVSRSGASLFSGLELKIGDSVRVIKQHGGFSAKAVVRNRRTGGDNLPRLHVEFLDASFPLDGVE